MLGGIKKAHLVFDPMQMLVSRAAFAALSIGLAVAMPSVKAREVNENKVLFNIEPQSPLRVVFGGRTIPMKSKLI